MTTHDVVIVRPHVKMLAGDYLLYANLAHDRGLDSHCRMCQLLSSQPAPSEDMMHLITRCRATAETRNRIMPNLFNTISIYYPNNRLLWSTSHALLTQFILDCSSLNLPVEVRVPPIHPGFLSITRECSILIYGIHKDRTRHSGQLTGTLALLIFCP